MDSYNGYTFCDKGCQLGRAGRSCSDVSSASICNSYSNCQWSKGSSSSSGSDSDDSGEALYGFLGLVVIAGIITALVCCCRQTCCKNKNDYNDAEIPVAIAHQIKAPQAAASQHQLAIPAVRSASILQPADVTASSPGSTRSVPLASVSAMSVSVTQVVPAAVHVRLPAEESEDEIEVVCGNEASKVIPRY